MFLVQESTMAARITRAKKKIAAARIPYRVPRLGELPERTDAVLTVVHLVFTTGHTAPVGADLVRPDLAELALSLARMLRQLLPDDSDVAGLLGLILLTHARRRTRVVRGRLAGPPVGPGQEPLGRGGHHRGPGTGPRGPGAAASRAGSP